MEAVRAARAADSATEPGGRMPARLRAVIAALGKDARRRQKAAEALHLGAGLAVLAEGPHLLEEAMAAGLTLVAVVATDAALARPPATRLPSDVPVYAVSPAGLGRLASTRAPQGIVAVVALDGQRLCLSRERPWPLGKGGVALALVGVQDPGNVGSLARSARAAGAALVALDGRCARVDDPKTLRASQGALFSLPTARLAGLDAIAAARAVGARVVAAVPRGGVAPWHTDLRGPLTLLLGGEGAGLAQALVDQADVRVTLPMVAGESLGVAAAGAALLFERSRQMEG